MFLSVLQQCSLEFFGNVLTRDQRYGKADGTDIQQDNDQHRAGTRKRLDWNSETPSRAKRFDG